MYNYLKNIIEERTSKEFRFKHIAQTRNYFVEEIKQNELMSKRYKKVCVTLSLVIEHFLSDIVKHEL